MSTPQAAQGAPAGDPLAQAVKSAIDHITALPGGAFLVTLTDGQEVKIAPGDGHTLGPLTRDTTIDLQDGAGPQNMHALYHDGALPADLHQSIIGGPTPPSAAEAGLHPGPMMPGEPMPDDSAIPDEEDATDGGDDEEAEGEPPLPAPPEDAKKKGAKKPPGPTMPGE